MAARRLVLVSGSIVLVAFAATLVWIAATTGFRPLDGVEGDVLFEASRIRARLPLYVDPAIGAHDYGPVPARYMVLYTPIWPAILALLGANATLGRLASTAAWLGLFAWIVHTAPRARRARTALAAMFAVGTYVLALYGASARPDALAVCAAGLALARATRRGSIDLLAGALFAFAAWVKPNVIGLAPGAFVAALLVARKESLRGLLGAFFASSFFAALLSATSDSAWIHHLLASTGQPPSLDHWLEQMASRAPFFALPLGAAIALAWRARRDAGAAIAAGALLSSTAWAILSLAKIGSASNYLMEPMVAAVVVVAVADVPELGPRARVAAAALLLGQCAWNGVASVRSALEAIPRDRERAQAIAAARAICGSAPEDVVIADEPGLELMEDGRIVQTPFQSTHLARRGRFPLDAWLADVRRPEVTCLLMQDDLLERPLGRVDVEHDRFGPELRRALASRFVLATDRAGIRVYRLRVLDRP